MSAQQIKLNINDLVNRIEDEDKLQACYIVLATIANDNKKQPKPKAAQSPIPKQKKTAPSRIKNIEPIAESSQNNVVSHDLSLVFLANDIFKGAEPLSEVGEIAFEKAFKKSLKKESSLPNRL